MAPYKGWYLLAVGILALGINNSSVAHHAGLFHALTGRVTATAYRISVHTANQLATAAIMLTGCPAKHMPVPRPDELIGPEFVQVQVALAQHRAQLERIQAEFVRMRAERARTLALAHYERRSDSGSW